MGQNPCKIPTALLLRHCFSAKGRVRLGFGDQRGYLGCPWALCCPSRHRRQDCCKRLPGKPAGKTLGSRLTQKPFAAEKDMPEVGMPSNLFGEGAGGAAGSNDQPTDPGWEKRERGVEGECLA